MSYNGSGTFQINTSGQPVVAGTVISATAFNALTADLATGLSTAITKDGQTTTTARIPFAAGISSTLTTDSSSVSTGSIITAGGVGVAKNLYVGVNANVAGTLGVTGVATFSAAPIYSSLTASSAVATDAFKALVSVTNTGTGNNVLATSPTLVTPILGTPQSGSLVNCTDTNYTGFKNRIINGAMVIDQRNAGAAVTASGAFPVDRFAIGNNTDGAFSAQQDSSAPTGFVNSLKFTTTTADGTIAASQDISLQQKIEGTNIADLNWGATAASAGQTASPVTLSFWVKSSLTGTFSGAIANSAYNRSYPFTYTISVANTWEYKTITIPGDTSGTWLTTTGTGLRIYWNLGSGTDNTGTAGAWVGAGNVGADSTVAVIGTLSATWFITGVQLEKGSTATSFDYRPYGTELQLCQRYYQQYGGDDAYAPVASLGIASGSVDVKYIFVFPVQMRATPSVAQSTLQLVDGATSYTVTGISQGANEQSRKACNINFSVASGLTQFRPYWVRTNNNASGYLAISAEL